MQLRRRRFIRESSKQTILPHRLAHKYISSIIIMIIIIIIISYLIEQVLDKSKVTSEIGSFFSHKQFQKVKNELPCSKLHSLLIKHSKLLYFI